MISAALVTISARCRRFSRSLCVSRRDEDGPCGAGPLCGDELARSRDIQLPSEENRDIPLSTLHRTLHFAGAVDLGGKRGHH